MPRRKWRSIKLQGIKHISRIIFAGLGHDRDSRCQVIGELGDAHRGRGQAAFIAQVCPG